jgi:hypothetical protein
LTVFAINMAIVIGPTPPGTGYRGFRRDLVKGHIASSR